MQISGEPMPNFTFLFNVQSQAPPTLLLVLAKLMYVLDDGVHRQVDRCLSEILGVISYFNKSLHKCKIQGNLCPNFSQDWTIFFFCG